MTPKVVIALDAAGLDRERPNLQRGSVVGAGAVPVGTLCDLTLTFPGGERFAVAARAVMAAGSGTVFAFDAHDRAALARLLAAPPPARPLASAPPPAAPAGEEEPLAEHAPLHVQERLRGLSVVEQLKVAREGNQAERVVLERLYGKTVWEALLRNARLTVPEVARLARLGTMPRPLLELVVSNPAWMQVPQVRRALLSNPRLSPDMVARVLQALGHEELKLVPQITAYPAAVRMAAKAMLHR